MIDDDDYDDDDETCLVYVDMGLSSNNPVVLTVVTAGASFSRTFSVKITQIECNALSKGEENKTFYYPCRGIFCRIVTKLHIYKKKICVLSKKVSIFSVISWEI